MSVAVPPPSVPANPTPGAPGSLAANAPTTKRVIAPDAEAMIRIDHLTKRFKIYTNPAGRAVEWLTLGRVNRHTDFYAVRDVSFEVRRGECLGILGVNGSGKSTLLKLITGALHPTAGSCQIRGRVLSLIELGTGLNPMLTGRQNISNTAQLLNFPPEYAREKLEDIRAFADLGEFFDRPVRTYSSGMTVRLAFSIFACFDPDVFIVDEALSVGDVFFQQKCASLLRSKLDAGLTMLFVSHDQNAVMHLCDRALMMDHGHVVFEGLPPETLHRYNAARLNPKQGKWKVAAASDKPGGESDAGSAAQPTASTKADDVLSHNLLPSMEDHPFGTGEARILGVRARNEAGVDSLRVIVGETVTLEALIEARSHLPAIKVGIHLHNRFNALVFAINTQLLGQTIPSLAEGDRIVVRFSLTLDVDFGPYTFTLGIAHASAENATGEGQVCHRTPALGPIEVAIHPTKPRGFFGAARLPSTVSLARLPRETTRDSSPAPTTEPAKP